MFTLEERHDVAYKTLAWMKIFFMLNLMFDLAFTAGGLTIFTRHIYFIVIVAILTFLADQQLYIYVKEIMDRACEDMNARWYMRHYNTIMYYCVLKFVLFMSFIVVSVVDSANIDLLHIFIYLADDTMVCLSVMLLLFIVMMFVGAHVMPKQRQVVHDVVEFEASYNEIARKS